MILRPIEILLVEDNPGDVRLTQEALAEANLTNTVTVAGDGVEAMAILRREGEHADATRPDLILLDVNLPKMDGRQVLEGIRGDADLKSIPVVILTSSQAEEDILRAYELNANCYVRKPAGLDEFLKVVRSIKEFWLSVVTLPEDQ